MLKGIDISKWQATTPSLAGLSFIVIRASVGGSKDTVWDTHYANARKAGLVTMAYHYGMPASGTAIATQAAKFLEVAANADFLWLDQEEAGFDDVQAQQFIDLVRAAGRPCGLYHSSSGFGGVSCDAKWVADWRDASEAAGYPRTADGSAQFPGWDLWQYDGGGADNVDNDYLNPASPLAGLLRRGYVTKASADATAAALVVQLSALTAQLGEQRANALELEAQVEVLTAAVASAEAEALAAAEVERGRIADAEANRIRSI